MPIVKGLPNPADRLVVVASAGFFHAVQVTYPGPRENWMPAFECEYCGTVFLCNDRKDLPPHACLGPADGVRKEGP